MAETVGWLTDKIVIAELKIYHTAEQLLRPDAGGDLLKLCRLRLSVLKAQRDDLARELSALFRDIERGRVKPRLYRQFKMYNDPRFMGKAGIPRPA